MATSKLQALWNHPAGPKTSELTRFSHFSDKFVIIFIFKILSDDENLRLSFPF